MGSMSITKPAICNLSSALPQSSNYVFLPPKVSGIRFPSSTNYPQGTKLYSSNKADVSIGDEKKKSDSYDEALEKMGRALEETKDKAYEIKEGMKGRVEDLQVIASEMADMVADKAQEAKDAKEKVEAMHEKNMESAGSMGDKAGEAKDRAVEMGQNAIGKLEDLHEKNMESVGSVVDKSKEIAENMKESVEEAVESAQKIGEMAKQNVQDAWDASLATTKSDD